MQEERNGVPPGFPSQWLPALRTVHTLPVAARNERELACGIAYLKRRGIFEPSGAYVFKQLSTVSFLVALAAKRRYRRIVLCGVDLRGSEYFYQEPELYPETRELMFVSPQSRHSSLTAIPWRVAIDRVLLELKRQVLDPEGIEIYVENRSSALWPAIAEAPQELFELEVPPTKPRFGTVRERSGEGRFPQGRPNRL